MKKPNQTDKNSNMPLSIKNYHLILIGIGLIIIGFILLSGGKSESPDVFNEAMFSFRRLVIAPIFLVGGFALQIVAIMKRFGEKKDKSDN